MADGDSAVFGAAVSFEPCDIGIILSGTLDHSDGDGDFFGKAFPGLAKLAGPVYLFFILSVFRKIS